MSDLEAPPTFQRPLIPNPCLIAILLVVRDTTEVDFVFHYPPHPRMGPTPNTSLWRSGNSGTSSESSAYTTSEDEEEEHRSRSTVRVKRNHRGPLSTTERSDTISRSRSYERRSSRHGHHVNSDHELEEDEGEETSPGPYGHDWDHVLGFKKEVLASLLSPVRSICKRRFELVVHNTVFLGYPVHVRSDGAWRKRSNRRKRRGRKESGESMDAADGDEDNEDENADEADDEDNADQSPIDTRRDSKAESEPWSPMDGTSEVISLASKTATLASTGNPPAVTPTSPIPDGSEVSAKMTMFHVVFVMNPPQLEYHSRIEDMYERVVKPFTRALKLEQANDNYVRREAELILEIKEHAARNGTGIHDLWNQILLKSNLAYSISKVYQAISQSKIAHITLNEKLEFSMQIPLASQISSLPSLIDAQLPGLYLTTAHSFGNDESEEDSMLVQHYSLLLLEEPESIIKELVAEQGDMNALMIQFIKCIHPTLPFTYIAQECNLPMRRIEELARHLIYWRKARAIPPLHHRNYYIVSPNADMKKLSQQISQYNRLFPTLPSLPEMLSMLSSKPRPYTMFIPSRDHRMAYIDILAWLMRHGWIIQLRSFAWLKITKEIKIAVAERQHLEKLEEARRREESEKEKESEKSQNGDETVASSTIIDSEKSGDTTTTTTSEQPSDNNSEVSLPLTPSKELGLNGSVRTRESLGRRDRVTFAEQLRGRSPNPSPARSGVAIAINSGKAISTSNGAGGVNATAAVIDPNDFEDSILADPMRPTSLESQWMEQLTKDCAPDVIALFDRIAKYLNGENAMEMIALREGISRKEVRRVLNVLGVNLVLVRHW